MNKTLHDSEFSVLTYDQQNHRIVAIWKESNGLSEQQAKDEISRVLDHVEMYKVRTVVIDARKYPLTNNDRVQAWINSTYLPRLMETTVVKYAFVIDNPPEAAEPDPDNDLPLQMEYFKSLEEATQWVSKNT